MKILLFFFLLTLPFIQTKGQPVTPQAELDYVIEEFVLPGGRLANNVNCIVQGPYGFMWFGSHGGLHRYDGNEFVTYKNIPGDTVGETASLTFPYIEWLYWDRSEKLWVATYGGGLFRFDPVDETFTHFKHDPTDSTSISHGRVLSIVEDVQGQLWFGTQHGLNRYDRQTGKFKRYYADKTRAGTLYDDDVRTLYIDKQGALWLGTGFSLYGSNPVRGALSRYNPTTDSFVNYRSNPDGVSAVRGILDDSRGNFWVGTEKGLCLFDRQSGSFQLMDYDPMQPFAPGAKDRANPAVYSIHEDHEGGLWVGTIGDTGYSTHLLRYNPLIKTSQIFPVQSSAWQICESADGTLWLAGAGDSGRNWKIRSKPKTYDILKGQFLQKAFGQSPLANRLHKDKVYGPMDISIDPTTGHYWLLLMVGESIYSNFDLVLGDFDPKSGGITFHHLNIHPKTDFGASYNRYGYQGLAVDKRGAIWGSFPSENIGIFNYDPATRRVKQYTHHEGDTTTLISNNILSLLMDRQGDIWVTLYQGGVDRLNPVNNKITHYRFNQQGDSDEGVVLMEDKDGMIWVAGLMYTTKGFSFFEIINPFTGETRKLIQPDPGTQRFIMSMAQSPVTGEVVFTIAGNGIGIYNPESGKFTYKDADNGFPFTGSAGVVCDRDGIFWIPDLMTRTIIRVGNDSDMMFQYEGTAPASWRTMHVDSNGHVFSMSQQEFGWLEIDPALIKPKENIFDFKVRLVDLYVLGEKQKPGRANTLPQPLWQLQQIELPASADNFAIHFSDFNFKEAGHQYLYRLYPFEETWRFSVGLPAANYYRIPTGNYTFQVKSEALRGFNEENLTEIKVIILPPWWQTWWAYVGFGFLFLAAVFAVHRFQRERVIKAERERTRDRDLAQAKEIEKAYTELKTTQTQLIQSEKMASLGELTAGIAHEIQNPLNFVNNFSEVNAELIDEMEHEMEKGNLADVKAIGKNIKENQEKISHHGKRADAIVKSMLQHSRSSSHVKEPTNINALAEEYLRLAYHGLRAKDKSFNATMKTEFDPNIGSINVIPQDIGRVILNLITNAFYAVSERKQQQGRANGVDGRDYEPTVVVSSKKLENKVEIRVKDNGNGIPQKVLDKIFQPFFTTKPTGQGTGLGLSLSYDIVKAHGGDIKVNTKENEGSEFVITLPR